MRTAVVAAFNVGSNLPAIASCPLLQPVAFTPERREMLAAPSFLKFA
jgi:hypothetical protein